LHHGGQSSVQRLDEDGRRCVIFESIYKALEQHRGQRYVRTLQVTALLAAGLEWLTSRVRTRPTQELTVSLVYHLRALKGAGEASRLSNAGSRGVTKSDR